MEQQIYLFFLEEDEIRIIKRNKSMKDGFEIILEKGEEYIKLKDIENFWSWWKKKISFVDEDITDFCFIYDKEYYLVKEFLNENSQKTSWNIRHIEKFFENYTNYKEVDLIDINGNNKKIKFTRLEFTDAQSKIFYTNLEFESVYKRSEFENEIPPAVRHYRKKIEEENMKY